MSFNQSSNLVNRKVIYEGKVYLVERLLEMKDVTNGAWLSAYLYTAQQSGKSYVREQKDFEAKFRVV